MAFIDFTDNLKINIPLIDEQHKKLIAMINELNDAMRTGKGKDALGKILNGLVAYTKSHFALEETLMQKHNYPAFSEHKKEHTALCDQVLAFGKKFEANEPGVAVQVCTFLKEWITTHIQGTDKKYAPFLIEKGVK